MSIPNEDLNKGAPTMILTKLRYDQLKNAEDRLRALKAAGVDNWSGYDYAMSLLNEDEV